MIGQVYVAPDMSPPIAKAVPVMEIFGPTIQGEGHMVGVQTHFIRFGLCDYKCTMCDSMHAVDPRMVKQNAKWMKPIELIRAWMNHLDIIDSEGTRRYGGPSWVTLSGGNPCIHDLSMFVMALINNQFHIAVETQGTFRPEWLHHCDVITVSPKGPGMGEQFEKDKFSDFISAFKDHGGLNIKVVIFDQRDLEFACMIHEIMGSVLGSTRRFKIPKYLSLGNSILPGSDVEILELRSNLLCKYEELSEELLQQPQLADWRFLPQLHVLAWGNKQGV
jgi:7-carboxy-7-deazaguanine synthase